MTLYALYGLKILDIDWNTYMSNMFKKKNHSFVQMVLVWCSPDRNGILCRRGSAGKI